MTEYEGIRKPLQKRSQQTAERVLEAFDILLREKSLDAITMQELSQVSKAAISSIYARFDGKDAMLVALHEKITEQSVQLIDELMRKFAEGLHSNENPKALLTQLFKRYLAFARSNKHIYRAIMLSNHAYAYDRIVAQNHAASKACFTLLNKMPGIAKRGLEERVDVAVRLLSSTCQQMWFFGDANPGRLELNDDQLAKQLAIVIMGYLIGNGLNGNSSTGNNG